MQLKPRKRAKPRRGAVALETALGLPLFFLLIFAMIEMTRLGQAYNMLCLAAREGCRVAVIPGNTETDAENAVSTILSSAGITTNTPVWTWGSGQTSLAGTNLGDPVTLTLSVPFSSVSWLATPLFLGSTTLTATATHCSENPSPS
jgi:Flp pilus assembly protein TadG